MRSAMPVWVARQKCPHLKVLPVPRTIEDFSHKVRDILEEMCPVVEPASVDEFFLDFTGCDLIYPRNIDIADRIMRRLEVDPGLPATIGIGTNKLIAKIASDLGKPRGILEVFPGAEGRFLAPLDPKHIPGVGPKMQESLKAMGLKNIRDILSFPIETWQAAFGRSGVCLHDHAQGVSHTPVVASSGRGHQKGISRDETLAEDSSSKQVLLAVLSRLVESAAYDLRASHLTCGGITVKIRYSDFSTTGRSARLARTDRDRPLFAAAENLFHKVFTRRLKVRLVGVHLDDLQPGGVTLDLLEACTPPSRRGLPQVIDQIRSRYGFRSLLRCRSVRKGETRRRA